MQNLTENNEDNTPDGHDVLEEGLNIILSYAKLVEDKELTLVLGLSGVGKSALINYLLGHKMKYQWSEVYKAVTLDVEDGKADAEIFHRIKSGTLYTQRFIGENISSVLVDCPGFDTSRMVLEEAILESLGIEVTISKAKNIKGIIIVIPYGHFLENKIPQVLKMMKILDKLFRDPQTIFWRSCIVINQLSYEKLNRHKIPTAQQIDDEINRIREDNTIHESLGQVLFYAIDEMQIIDELKSIVRSRALDDAKILAMSVLQIMTIGRKLNKIFYLNPIDNGESREAIKKGLLEPLPSFQDIADRMVEVLTEVKFENCFDIRLSRYYPRHIKKKPFMYGLINFEHIKTLDINSLVTIDNFNFSKYDPNRISFDDAMAEWVKMGTDLFNKLGWANENYRKAQLAKMQLQVDLADYIERKEQAQTSRDNKKTLNEHIIGLNKSLSDNNAQLLSAQQQQRIAFSQLNFLGVQLATLNVNTPISYSSYNFEGYVAWYKPFGWLVHDFNVDTHGVEILQNICLPDNGKCKINQDDKKSGVFEATYISDYYSRPARAKFETLIRTKDNRDNKLNIINLKNQIQHLQSQLPGLQIEINNLTQKGADIQSDINKYQAQLTNIANNNNALGISSQEIINHYNKEIKKLNDAIKEKENYILFYYKNYCNLLQAVQEMQKRYNLMEKIEKIPSFSYESLQQCIAMYNKFKAQQRYGLYDKVGFDKIGDTTNLDLGLIQILKAKFLCEPSSDEQGNTALHIVAQRGYVELLEDLYLCSAIKLNEKNKLQQTALHVAILNGQTEIVTSLIKKLIRTPQLKIELSAKLTVEVDTVNYKMTPLQIAVMLGQNAVVAELLQHLNTHDELLNSNQDKLGTLLHMAVLFNQVSTLKKLLELYKKNSIDYGIIMKDPEGFTPLHRAAALGNTHAINVLYNAGSKTKYAWANTMLVTYNKNHETPAHSAVRNQHGKVLSLLFQLGGVSAINSTLQYSSDPKSTPYSLAEELRDNLQQKGNLFSRFKYKEITDLLARLILRATCKFEDYENMVFQGGGIKGIAYWGALQEFVAVGYSLDKIKRVAGTSVGSIIALLVALNFTLDEMKELLSHPFKDFLEEVPGPSLVGFLRAMVFDHFFENFMKNPTGIISGQKLLEWVEKIISNKLKKDGIILKNQAGNVIYDSKYLTFGDLKKLVDNGEYRYKHLYVVGTLINNFADPLGIDSQRIFSSEGTEYDDFIIADAIRLSASIPYIFFPHHSYGRYSSKNGKYNHDELYVDGLVVNNFPINIFDDKKFHPPGYDLRPGEINTKTIGFSLLPAIEKNRIKEKTRLEGIFNQALQGEVTLSELMKKVFSAIMFHELVRFNKAYIPQTVFIGDNDIDPLKFDLSEREKEQLIMSGKKAVNDLFDTHYKNKASDCSPLDTVLYTDVSPYGDASLYTNANIHVEASSSGADITPSLDKEAGSCIDVISSKKDSQHISSEPAEVFVLYAEPEPAHSVSLPVGQAASIIMVDASCFSKETFWLDEYNDLPHNHNKTDGLTNIDYIDSSDAPFTDANTSPPFDAGAWDPALRMHPVTKEFIFTYRAYKESQEVGSLSFYKHPLLCRSEVGDRHNLIEATGIFANIDIDANSIEDICESLPPTLFENVITDIS